MGVSWIWLIIGFCFGALTSLAGVILWIKHCAKWLRDNGIKLKEDDMDNAMDTWINL